MKQLLVPFMLEDNCLTKSEQICALINECVVIYGPFIATCEARFTTLWFHAFFIWINDFVSRFRKFNFTFETYTNTLNSR